MYFLAAISGLAIGAVLWFIVSGWIAHSVVWVESRNLQLTGSRALRAGEAAACGLLFIGCLVLAFWIARLLWIQWR